MNLKISEPEHSFIVVLQRDCPEKMSPNLILTVADFFKKAKKWRPVNVFMSVATLKNFEHF